MKTKYSNSMTKIFFLTICSCFILSSCEDYLDQEPQDVVSEVIYFQTPDHFTTASNYFYTRLGFFDGDVQSDLSNNMGDVENYAHGNTIVPTTDPIWNDNYTHLRAVNQLIEKVDEYPGDYSEIAVPVATAHFFRAWHHYLLLKRFGGVPIVATSLGIDSEDLYAARNSRYEVVDQMIKDLDVAISGLPSQNALTNEDQGKLTLEAAKSFKARILLYEATWEKYVGTATDGDGSSVGAGSAKPDGYPDITAMFSGAKQEALDVINSGAFELWDHREDIGDDHLFYLFNLEDGGSNPAGLTKANNREYIFQTVYDFTLRQTRLNITHARPHSPTRKLMDMFLCTDGLPVQLSPVFQGYSTLTSEYENRDLRVRLNTKVPLQQYWGWGAATAGGGAQYGTAFENSGIEFDYRYVPQLVSPGNPRNIGYEGRKFTTEHRLRETREESFNYPLIRLAEVMLIYAEATCELGNGNISDADLDISINKIRERSGVAPLTNALIAPYSDLNMLGEIRRERAIELFGENFRFDDLKRWNIAPEELNNNVCATYIEGTEYETAENPLNPGTTIYKDGVWPYGLTSTEKSVSSYAGIANHKPGALIIDAAGNRNFKLQNYLDPIPSNQIRINDNLLQNPGW
uniref:RagB/SusD family nutrient uptake outer membrane protein n=1 Tax=Roseihalotalea indica TaxID=2867963 RepID=A0AA49JID9_9BACT|nr:RagB/SusD family nutrient uptake outer membrane protein [Tunicatimonas sp. TK19036]